MRLPLPAWPALMLLATVLVGAAFPVAGQVPSSPATPESHLELRIARDPASLPLGGSAVVPVAVALSISGVFCPIYVLPPTAGPATATVALGVAAKRTSAGITWLLRPSQLTINLTRTGIIATTPYDGKGTAWLVLSATSATQANHDQFFNVNASFDPSTVTGYCTGGLPIPSASASTLYQARTGPSPGRGVEGKLASAKSPAPSAIVALLGAATGVVLRRRRDG
ncbi:MAG: hypothetical protein ACYDBQ_09360 [Thermoplasmatota archaeon]